MLNSLKFSQVGPTGDLSMDPVAPRFNLITGDNGLGKTFLLECAWWALTRTWHGWPVRPNQPNGQLSFAFGSETNKPIREQCRWDVMAQDWKRKAGRPPNPGLVLYARVDGSFSVWDPARNYRLYKRPDGSEYKAPPAYQFSADQVLYGLPRIDAQLPREGGAMSCNGLVADWTTWQRAQEPTFDLLRYFLAGLSPDGQPLEPGPPVHAGIDDDRRFPTIRMPYGIDVPLPYAPSGVQRMSKLAYLLAWALDKHERESAAIGIPISKQVIVLIDEPETHLHPRWQRTVVPSLEKIIKGWHPTASPAVQLLVATHAPMVLASMEPIFDPTQDALWELDLASDRVALHQAIFTRRGDVSRWLTSTAFDLKEARSLEAEKAITAALALLRSDEPLAEDVRKVTQDLAAALGDTDRFWVRWSAFAENLGVRA